MQDKIVDREKKYKILDDYLITLEIGTTYVGRCGECRGKKILFFWIIRSA